MIDRVLLTAIVERIDAWQTKLGALAERADEIGNQLDDLRDELLAEINDAPEAA